MRSVIAGIWESSLRKRLRENDRAAFEDVVRSQYAIIYRHLYFLANGDENRAADLTQEVFVAAWQALPTFDGRSAIGTWLHTITVRVWYRSVRQGQQGSPSSPLAEALSDLLADPGMVDPATQVTDAARHALLAKAVNALPVAYRRAVYQFYTEEKRYREIAESEGIAIGTVKSRLSTAIRLLQERLQSRKEELL